MPITISTYEDDQDPDNQSEKNQQLEVKTDDTGDVSEQIYQDLNAENEDVMLDSDDAKSDDIVSSSLVSNSMASDDTVSIEMMSSLRVQSSTVDTVIAGKVYGINCPIGEEKELESAIDYINDAITDIRQTSPGLSHENLLVLCCLNLFEQLKQATDNDLSQTQTKAHAEALIDNMLEDLQAVQ